MLGKKTETLESNDMSPIIKDSQGNINISYGPKSEELRYQVLGILWESFPRLRDEALKESKAYIEDFTKDVFTELSAKNFTHIEERFKDPEIIATITETLYSVAKRTNKVDTQILKDILIKKLENDEESDERGLVLNKALETAAELTKSQIVFLAFIYSLKHLTLFFKGVQINFINRILPVNSESQNSILIDGRVISIEEVRGAYSDFYETIFNKVYLNPEIKALIKPVDKYYLEYARCISINEPTSTFMVSDHTVSIGFKKNTGIDFYSEQGIAAFKSLHFILEEFGIEHIDQINEIYLSPIGMAIAESFIETESGFTIIK